MAEAIPFIGSNKELNPPKDAGPKALTLPVLTNGKSEWISCWQFDSSEVDRIVETGRVWLRVKAKNHPWLSVHTEEPGFDSDD